MGTKFKYFLEKLQETTAKQNRLVLLALSYFQYLIPLLMTLSSYHRKMQPSKTLSLIDLLEQMKSLKGNFDKRGWEKVDDAGRLD